jgi:6-pyruvoyltetrahydropterin/6-carboxytetrahydropterin synthase
MPRLSIARRATFSAAHRLYDPSLTDEENARVFGKCASPHSHGHNYVLEIYIGGAFDRRRGMIADLKWLKDVIDERLLGEVDHRNLNLDVSFLEGINPTAENLALAFWERLAPAVEPTAHLVKLRLWETENNLAEVVAD